MFVHCISSDKLSVQVGDNGGCNGAKVQASLKRSRSSADNVGGSESEFSDAGLLRKVRGIFYVSVCAG